MKKIQGFHQYFGNIAHSHEIGNVNKKKWEKYTTEQKQSLSRMTNSIT